MKHKTPKREAGLIPELPRLAPPDTGGPTMSYLQSHPEARQWLTPDHQAVLAIIARWAGETSGSQS